MSSLLCLGLACSHLFSNGWFWPACHIGSLPKITEGCIKTLNIEVIFSTVHELFLQLSDLFLFSSQTKHSLLSDCGEPLNAVFSYQADVSDWVSPSERYVWKSERGSQWNEMPAAPAVMAPELFRLVPHHQCFQWCTVVTGVKKCLADGCFSSWRDVNRDILPLSFPFLWSLHKAPGAQEEARTHKSRQTLGIRKSSELVFW